MTRPTEPKKEREPKHGHKAMPIRPYIHMEITDNDSKKNALYIILTILTSIFIFSIQDFLIFLLAIMADQVEKIGFWVRSNWDVAGYAASLLVIAAFCMKDILYLRAVAILSNITFLIYGIALGLQPIWLLHGILLPLNCWRLTQAVLQRRVG